MGHGNICWSECVTSDVEAAKAHYEALCGWTFEGMPMPGGTGTYWVAKQGDTMVCGLMAVADLPGGESIPPHWMTYVEVADVDATVDKVAGTGGKVQAPPFDVPGVGRIAMVTDPGGAMVGLMTPSND